MKSRTYTATLVRDGSMCIVPVPFDPVPVFGKVRAPVKVTLNGYTYRSTIAAMGGPLCIPLRKSNREAAGLEGNETLKVRLELDTDARVITPPADFVQGAEGGATRVGPLARAELQSPARVRRVGDERQGRRDARAPYRARGAVNRPAAGEAATQGRSLAADSRKGNAMERAVPVLPADDLTVARDFYVRGLGFSVRFEASEDGRSGIMGLERGTIDLTIDAPMSGHGREACGARTFDVMDPFGNTIFVIGPMA